MKNVTIVTLCCSLLIMLFVYAGTSKLLDYSLFKWQLSQSPLLAIMAGTVAIGIPVAEFVVCGLLLFERTRLKGLYWSLLLLAGFTVYILYMLYLNDHTPCSCGGVLKSLSWQQHIWFNVLFIIMAVTAIVFSRNPPGANPAVEARETAGKSA